MADILLRFVIGGLVVSSFAVLSDMIKPDSLGGIFGAAPTIALATLVMTFHKQGAAYVGLEGRSMIAGGAAFFLYAAVVSFVLMRARTPAAATALLLLVLWFGTVAGLYALWLRN